MNLKVSIITVVYNNFSTINETINSVIAQSYSNIEYIVIDGNSTDGTRKILESRKKDIDILVSEPDSGIYDAMNKGINLATGDIIGTLNADDFFADNNVVTRIISAFETDSSIQAIYSNVVFIDDSGQQKITRYYSSKNFYPWMFKFGFQPAHPTFYIKKQVFKQYGIYRTDLRIAGDFELLMRFMLRYKIKHKYIEDVWVKMRTGGASTSGLKSVFSVNSEILIACKANSVYTNKIMIYSKYLIKWWGFIIKKI